MTQFTRPPKDSPKSVILALHKRKMMGKHFRRFEQELTLRAEDVSRGFTSRPNMSDRTLEANYPRSLVRKFRRLY